jgi:hypothetical protein
MATSTLPMVTMAAQGVAVRVRARRSGVILAWLGFRRAQWRLPWPCWPIGRSKGGIGAAIVIDGMGGGVIQRWGRYSGGSSGPLLKHTVIWASWGHKQPKMANEGARDASERASHGGVVHGGHGGLPRRVWRTRVTPMASGGYSGSGRSARTRWSHECEELGGGELVAVNWLGNRGAQRWAGEEERGRWSAAWALEGEDEASRRSSCCLRRATKKVACPTRVMAVSRGGGHRQQAGSLLLTSCTVHDWHPIFSLLILSNSNRNLLSSLNQCCSSIEDLWHCLRNQTHQLTGFEDFWLRRWVLQKWKLNQI